PNDTSTSTRATVTGAAIGLSIGLVALVTGALVLRAYGPGNMWAGYVTGASLALVAAGIAVWRAGRRRAATPPAERAFTPAAAERDRRVLSSAAATLGGFSLPLTGVAAVVIAVGTDPAPVLGILLWVLLAVFVIAFVRANRSM